MTKIELKECPFCGWDSGNLKMNEIDRRLFVTCIICRLCGPDGSTNTVAAENWNMIERETFENAIPKLLETTDEIERVQTIEDDSRGFGVGVNGITAIKPYDENGQLWLAIYKGDNIWVRMSAERSIICYKGWED